MLQPSDYEPGAPPVFVMRHKTWMERFGGDLSILNKTLVLNGTPRTVVGIMPPRFGWYGADVFIPEKTFSRDVKCFPILPRTPEAWRLDRTGGGGPDGHRPSPGEDTSEGYPPTFSVHVGRLGDSVFERISATFTRDWRRWGCSS